MKKLIPTTALALPLLLAGCSSTQYETPTATVTVTTTAAPAPNSQDKMAMTAQNECLDAANGHIDHPGSWEKIQLTDLFGKEGKVEVRGIITGDGYRTSAQCAMTFTAGEVTQLQLTTLPLQ